MTDEDRLFELLRKLCEATDPQQRKLHEDELIVLLDKYLRSKLAGWRKELEREGVWYTEVVNQFFLKLLQNRAGRFLDVEAESHLRGYLGKVLVNQVRDYFEGEKRGRQMLNEIAPFVKQRQSYYEDRYHTTYEDFVRQYLVEWLNSDDKRLVLQAQVLEDRYVGGVDWKDIARQRDLSNETVLKIQRAAHEQLRKKLNRE